MTQWFSKELGNGVEANAPSTQIQQAFVPLFAVHGHPIDMAVFSRHDLEKNIVTAYFSPGAEDLAKVFNAKKCEKPKKEGNLSLLVGDQRCIELFYPLAK
jgi:hypothetical protein